MMEACTQLLNALTQDFRRLLGPDLVGVYLHGSLAFGCFTWDTGDVDLLVVAARPLSAGVKRSLLDMLCSHWDAAPPKGVELSVLLRSACDPFLHPAPYELHFSPSWMDLYRSCPSSLCGPERKTDPDLAAHVTVLRQVGVALHGPPVAQVFGPVKPEDYLDSILWDIASAQEDILTAPASTALNLCRVLAYVEHGGVLSKQQGGQWALSRLPGQWTPLVTDALRSYSGGQAPAWPAGQARLFAQWMQSAIAGQTAPAV